MARDAVAHAREHLDEAAAAAEQVAADLADQAASMALPTTRPALDELDTAITHYARTLIVLRGAQRSRADAETVRAEASERAAEAIGVRDQRDAEVSELRTRAVGLQATFDELRQTVGASVAELQARLSQVEREIEVVGRAITAVGAQQLAAAAMVGTLEQKVLDLTQRREETAAVRDARVEALRIFAATGLLRVALPDLSAPADNDDAWHLTPALALARRAEHLLDGVDESADAWSRVQQRVSNAATELQAQMTRHGHTAYVEPRGDVVVARVRHLGDDLDVDLLADRLAADVADRERLLSAREREILENHLVNEVAGHLHELLLAADGQIDRMNRELAERKTSTGMQLRVRWRERVDGPAGVTMARRLMLRSDATWTAADRTAIGDFLQARIGEVRQADPTGGWQEHLEQALDYRHWHSFTVERLQHGQWRSASGPASGGEKVLAVSVPLFAAASAHYNSAGDLAPRLILLDEAFAGVDDDSRAKSLGLLATFDLDVVMTSEREWGCYPQVPGLSIARLSRVEGIDAVGVTRWRWDGRRRERLVEVDDVARATASGRSVEPDDDSLFG